MTPLKTAGWQMSPGAADADARAILDDGGELRLVFLSPTMARFSWRPAQGFREPRTWAISPVPGRDVPWDGRERDSLDGFERPALACHEQAPLQLSTGRLAVRLQGSAHRPIGLEWVDPRTGRLYQSDRATSAYLAETRTGLLRHCVARHPEERYFGLGDKTGPLDLHGRRLRCMGQDSLGYDARTGDPLYKHWPFVLTRTVDGLWTGVYYDTLAACTFDLGCEHDNYHGFFRTVEIDDGDLDYTIMVGETPAEVVAQFVRLIGGTHLPPRWSLGYAQTAMGLPDAPDAQQRLDAFIDQCAEHRIPISAFHYGSGYSSRGKRRYVFTWNRSKFPDPRAINAKFHAAGMRLVANLKPCLLDDHPAYESLAREGAFILHRGSGEPVLEPFWDGQGSHLDFTRDQAVAWWQRQLKEQILDQGIDVGWNDNNEYAIQAEDAYSAGWGRPIPMHRSRPLHSLLMTRATFDAQRDHARAQGDDQPVYTVTRAGPPGLQRYAQTWSGDNSTSWKTLKWNIRTGLQMSLSGMFNIGHDVGGFCGPVPDPELLLRWVQACSLNPRMVMNSWKTNGVTNLPWMHPEVEDAVRDAINLRYRLMPYLWQCVEQACRDDVPIIRPTFFNFPGDDRCFEDSDDFMLGDWLLIAPVVEEGLVRRRVYLPVLPQGGRWFALDTGEAFESGRCHEVEAPLERLPIFARQGARIPVSSPRPGKLAAHDDPVSDVLTF
ncbi:Alpha-glucosidase [Castellaniella defragrans 65Phen]|uniref:Alpha-glucosidase n=1 Tax=Castellaniella defragrans (strain DSM 12143 / CCUG 39792 / 65Phen) TaxID=1437824 RepID=W8X8B3_CASD6|nr:TIM-barrel domain-containing protein [Castellaniella defragrans]CDM22775.1 Alpha-glucosidase [Castellaniella defragrans 65Phen]